MQNIFDIVPDKFFSILASPLKRFYSDILFLIYRQYLLVNLGLKRELIIDAIVEYIETCQDQSLEDGLSDEIWEDSMDSISSSRERANFVLRKLESCGWVDIETYSNYEQYVNVTDYSVKIIDILNKVRQNHNAEYQGYVFATYSVLYTDDADRYPHITLEKAVEQTEALISGLKTLNHNIKRYIQQVVSQKHPKDILRMHFTDYKQDILDKAYHRLKTSDNVSKYRPKIIKKVATWYRNDDWVNRCALSDLERDKYPSLNEAKSGVLKQLDFIRHSFQTMDELLEEIDKRNSKYASSSFMRIKYILNTNKNTEGQILDILKYIADLIKEESIDMAPEDIQGAFSIFTHAFLNIDSLYTARELSKNHIPQDLRVSVLTEHERARLSKEFHVKTLRKMTRDKINEFVMDKLENKQYIKATDVVNSDMDDLIRLIYIAAYARSKHVDYDVDFDGERVIKSGYEFRDITIKPRRAKVKIPS